MRSPLVIVREEEQKRRRRFATQMLPSFEERHPQQLKRTWLLSNDRLAAAQDTVETFVGRAQGQVDVDASCLLVATDDLCDGLKPRTPGELFRTVHSRSGSRAKPTARRALQCHRVKRVQKSVIGRRQERGQTEQRLLYGNFHLGRGVAATPEQPNQMSRDRQ